METVIAFLSKVSVIPLREPPTCLIPKSKRGPEAASYRFLSMLYSLTFTLLNTGNSNINST